MSARDVHDYPCPECGHDGPHPVIDVDDDAVLVECGDTVCASEFTIRPDEEE